MRRRAELIVYGKLNRRNVGSLEPRIREAEETIFWKAFVRDNAVSGVSPVTTGEPHAHASFWTKAQASFDYRYQTSAAKDDGRRCAQESGGRSNRIPRGRASEAGRRPGGSRLRLRLYYPTLKVRVAQPLGRQGMAAVPAKADMLARNRHVRNVPIGGVPRGRIISTMVLYR